MPLKKILLLGAGFSHNWGGYLASELLDRLLGRPAVMNNNYLRQKLWSKKDSGGFEVALAEVQADFRREPAAYKDHLDAFQGAIEYVFDEMNRHFLDIPTIETAPLFVDRLIRTHFVKYDAIFTLNQDILLDHHYLDANIHLSAPGRWDGPQIPGMQRHPPADGNTSWGNCIWTPQQDPIQFTVAARQQPFIKLHGSRNWRAADGGTMLVIGANKPHAIAVHPILDWYFHLFQGTLLQPDVRLVMIGYGCRDKHVNDVLIQAVDQFGLKFYVVDPLGSGLAKAVNPTNGGPIYAPNELDHAFQSGLAGATNRPMRQIFGDDAIARGALDEFLTPNPAPGPM
jgi:hypothetical protein